MSLAAILQRQAGDIVRIAPDATVADAVALLAQRRIGALPVVEHGRVVGVMSERDVIYALGGRGASVLGEPVSAVMTASAITVESSIAPIAGLSLMTRRRIRHLPVVDAGELVGFVSIGDLVKARIEAIQAEAEAMRLYISG